MAGALAQVAKTPLGGWLLLLLIGSCLGYLYSYLGFNKLFGKEVTIKGAAYGVVVWIISLIVASNFPYLGNATFVEPIRTTLFLQVATSIVWGAALGLFFEQA